MVRHRVRLVAAIVAALAATASAAAAPLTSVRRGDGGLYVVGFEKRITSSARAALGSTGATVLDYEPVDSYLVWATAEEVELVRSLAPVADVRAVSPARKLDASLEGPTAGTVHVQLTVFRPQLVAATSTLAALGPVVEVPRSGDRLHATLLAALPASAIEDAVRVPAVLYATRASTILYPEDEMTDQVVAGNIEPDTNRPFPGYRDWLKKVGLNGKGIVAAVVDTGISPLHPDVEDKVVQRYNYSPEGLETVDSGGHGTHVAGIIGGVPRDDLTFSDREGFLYGLGMAPGAKFVDQNAIGTTVLEFPPPKPSGFETLSSDAWDAGARMWNASWHTGEGQRAGYLPNVRAFDKLARDAVADKPGLQEFLFVFSAGNAGTEGPTVPKEAKNIVAVGATNSGRDDTGLGTSSIDEVPSFSSRGPTKDGRIFPLIAAPGANVMSARAPEGAVTATCVPPPDGAALYANCSGTSMAAPHVTGASILVHQWWHRTRETLPSPAMVKALFVNTATDTGIPDIPNMNEGWGRVTLGELFAPREGLDVDQTDVLSEVRQQEAYRLRVRDGRRPLKVTLAWTDAPAAAGAKVALVNDLDLVVQLLDSDGSVEAEWAGNRFENGWSVAGGPRDELNNVENVFIQQPETGTYRVVVRAANVPGDAIPGNGDATDQDFALVARWARPTAR